MSQPTTGWEIQPSFCKHLRSKDLYLNLPFHPSGMESSEGAPCWCMQTQQALGPDGALVNRTDCMPGRACYETDEL